jgi:hypothetical protein
VHPARRGDAVEAAEALLGLLGRDNTPHTVVETAATTSREQLPDQVNELLEVRERALTAVRLVHDQARRSVDC